MKFLITYIFSAIFVLLNASAERDIKLELLWTHQFEFAGYYMAKEKGFYSDAGFNVEIIDGFKKMLLKM